MSRKPAAIVDPLNPPTVCPPHHWEVSTIHTDVHTGVNAAYYHHVCLRCSAQKDVPIAVAHAPAGRNKWPSQRPKRNDELFPSKDDLIEVRGLGGV